MPDARCQMPDTSARLHVLKLYAKEDAGVCPPKLYAKADNRTLCAVLVVLFSFLR